MPISSQRFRALVLPVTAWLALWVPPAQAAHSATTDSGGATAVPEATITARDVLARTTVILDDIEAIRVDMGKPKERRPLGIAHGMAPHEAYFQALTLYLKADRLALELTGSTGMLPPMAKPLEVQVRHVGDVVAAAHQRLLTVKRELGLTTDGSSETINPQATLTEVGYAIVRANRQLNLLLERRFTPSDAYQQVTVAIGYADALLSRFPRGSPVPTAPPFERGKTPGDVFDRLLKCYQRLQAVAKLSNIEVLHFDSIATSPADVLPSDVYDLATLLVSDLAYFHAHGSVHPQPAPVPYHGRKFPSHVYQQAGILDAQLTLLESLAQKDPAWLTH